MATHNNLRAATAALSVMATILLAVILLALRPIPAFAEENQAQEAAAGNISLSVPTELNCFVKADGQVITPEAKDYAIANTGTEEVMLDAVTVTANSDSGPISLSAEAFVGTTVQPAGTLSSWFSYSKDANGLGDVKSQEKQIIQPGQSLLAKWNVGKLNDKDNANVLNRLSGKDGFALATVTFTFKPKQAFAVLYDDGSAVLYKRCVKQMPVAGNGFNDGTGMRKVSKVVNSIENNEGIFEDDTLIKSVTVQDSDIRPKTTKQWFLNCVNLTNAELKQLDTSLTSSMEYMFQGCTELVSIDVSGWDTREVTNMSCVFTYCEKITELDLSSWDTSNVTDMYSLFYDCSKLQTISFPEDGAGNKWDTRKVTNMVQLFGDCYDLNPVDVSNWDTGSVTNMAYMFANCKKFDKFDLSRWDTGSVTDMEGMFTNCSGLKEITLRQGWKFKFTQCDLPEVLYVKNGDTYLVYNNDDFPITATTFYTQKGLRAFAVVYDNGTNGKIATLYKRYVGKMPEPGKLFDDGTGARQVSAVIHDIESDHKAGIFSDSDITAVSAADDDIQPSTMERWFSGCTNLKNVNLSRVDASKVVSMANMFAGCGSLAFLDLSGWDATNVKDMSGMFSACFQLDTIKLDGMKVQNVSNLNRMFANCEKLNTLNIPSDWCISKATDKGYTDMGYMFYACKSLKKIDFSKWNISNITNTEYMFYMCSNLSEIAIPSGENPWRVKGSRDDQSNDNGAKFMFGGCSSLLVLDLKNMNVEQVENMSCMFSGCSELTLLDLSGWNASNVKDMSGMFSGCIKLATLKLDSTKVQNASNMDRMFANCENLEMLSIPSDWNTSNVTNMSHMFYACKSIKGLDLSNWNVSSVTDMEQMFATCSNLQMLNLANWRTSGNPVANNLLTSCSSLRQITLGAGWSIDFAIAGFPKPLYVIRGNQYVALTGMPSLTQETTIYTESYKNEHPLEMRATSHDSTLSVEDSAPEPNANLESSSPRGQFDATATASSIVDAAIDQSANAAEECCDKHVDHELDNLDSNQSAKRSSFSLSKRQEKISIAA